MMTQNNSEYILLFRDTQWHQGLSAEEMQQVATQWMAWFNGLTEQGKAIAGRPLLPEGKIVSGSGGKVIADGPFVESKETIGGFFLLQVGSLEEAVEIAKDCPALPYGAVVEVRPVAEVCPAFEAVQATAEAMIA